MLSSNETGSGQFEPTLVNIGLGEEVTMGELALLVKQTVAYEGEIVFDASKLDGTPRKLLDVSRHNILRWRAPTSLKIGLAKAYADFSQQP
jgi:GDP-L-fucose synthase